MQIDGNFGITAGVCEMLLQSHEGEINPLPALPKAWPSGSANGLRARNGFEVDIAWRDGKLTAVTVRATVSGVCRVRWGERQMERQMKRGQTMTLDAALATQK